MESRVRESRARTAAVYALFLACALILSYIEALLPPLGIFKLGLANIAVVLAVCIRSRVCGFSVMLCRVCITSLLFGSVTSFAFSLFGGVLAFTVSAVLKAVYKRSHITLVGISVGSAAAHNAGQIFAACLVFSSTSPLAMLWWMLLVSVPAGLLTGITAQIIISRIGSKA